MREIKFSYIYQHDDTGRILNKIFDIHEIELELMSECFIKRYTLIARRQYTGLKDKNGVEIYEGDIIEYMTGQLKHIPTKHKVTWLKDEARFSFGCKADTQYMFYNTVVIGNIYENPELIQGD